MPLRFRKSYRILPGVKVNLSKSGMSFTVGPRGFHLTFGKRGVRQTIGLPGSGLSESSYIFKNEPESKKPRRSTSSHAKESEDEAASGASDADEELEGIGCSLGGCLLTILVASVLVYFLASTMHWIPSNYLSNAVQQLTQWLRSSRF
jgi:uncharacterized protein DUF4236